MRVSVINNFVANPDASPEIYSLVAAGAKRGILVDIVDIPSLKNLSRSVRRLGDVVLYRTASATGPDKQKKILEAIRARCILINEALTDQPWLRHKIYQQQVIAAHTDIPTIPTFRVTNRRELAQTIAEQHLTWPLIQKPNGGVRGRDITLIRSINEAAPDQTINRFVFQSFIPNQGDFRVLVAGRQVIGMMKRVAAPGSFLNNISQGATPQAVTDPAIRQQLTDYALTVIEVLQLDFIGVDIIQSTHDGRYYFLEVNLMPGWQGLVRATGADVGAAVIKLCQQRYDERQQKEEKI